MPPPTAANGDSLDWKDLSAQEIYTRVTTNVSSGSIVLFHNAALHTPEALPTIIQTLLREVEDQAVFAKGSTVVWQCGNCGFLYEGPKAPEKCPVCSHPQAYFRVVPGKG